MTDKHVPLPGFPRCENDGLVVISLVGQLVLDNGARNLFIDEIQPRVFPPFFFLPHDYRGWVCFDKHPTGPDRISREDVPRNCLPAGPARLIAPRNYVFLAFPRHG